MKLAAAVLALVLLFGCGESHVQGPEEALTIANPLLPHGSLVHVAAANGYFASEGLAVTLQPHKFGRLALDSLLEGKADLAFCAETPVVFAVLRGRQVHVFATIASASKNTVVVARRDAGIASPKDLAGKRVGVTRGTNAEFFLDTLLVRHGMAIEEVQVVDLNPDAMPDALTRGVVDAVAIWDPVATALRRSLGGNAVTLSDDDTYTETWNLAGGPDFVARRPAAVQMVLRALLRAEEFFREDPDEARRAVAPALTAGPGLDVTLGHFDFRVRLDQGLLVLMEEQSRWAIRSGLVPLQHAPNFLKTLEAKPLLAVKPEAVQLIR
jgi:NitT/TauT family transport system substrate-binding protein